MHDDLSIRQHGADVSVCACAQSLLHSRTCVCQALTKIITSVFRAHQLMPKGATQSRALSLNASTASAVSTASEGFDDDDFDVERAVALARAMQVSRSCVHRVHNDETCAQVPVLTVFEQLALSPYAETRERALFCLYQVCMILCGTRENVAQVLEAAGEILGGDAWLVLLRTLSAFAQVSVCVVC
jgi:hypothetical protein